MEDKKEVNSSITIKDLFAVIKINWLIILITTLVVTGVGAVYGFFLTKDTYTTSSSVIITSQEALSSNVETSLFSESLLATNTIKEFMSNEVVISAVADEMISGRYKEYKYQEIKNIIRDGLTISNGNQSLIINVTFSTKTTKILNQDKKDFVVDVANLVAKKSIEILNEKHQLDDGGYKYGMLLANRVQELSQASICQVSRSSFKITIVCFALGLILGYGISFVKYISVDHKRTNLDDLEEQNQ